MPSFIALKKCIFLFIALLISVTLLSCLPAKAREPEIVHATIGSHDLFIPRAYLDFAHTSIGLDSALLQTWYPGNAIPPSNSSLELAKQGIWWKNIRILISEANPDIPFDSVARKLTSYLKADKYIASEFGLQHYTHKESYGPNSRGLWLEQKDGVINSYITCTEILSSNNSSKCSYWARIENRLSVKASFDRRLLPEWQLIRGNIESLIQSFQSPYSAIEYLEKNNRKGE